MDYKYKKEHCFLNKNFFYKTMDLSDMEVEVFNKLSFTGFRIGKLILPKNVKKTQSSMFEDSSIEEIIFPKTLLEIEEGTFLNCRKLKMLDFSNTNLHTLGDCAFLNCKNLEKVILPDEKITISHQCFYGCENLKEIELKNVVEIKEYSFGECKNLKTVSLNGKISNNAFTRAGLEKVYLGSNSKVAPYFARECENLKEIYIKNVKDEKTVEKLKEHLGDICIEDTIDSLLNKGKSFKEINNKYKEEEFFK